MCDIFGHVGHNIVGDVLLNGDSIHYDLFDNAKGKFKLIIFCPSNQSSVCATELISISKQLDEFTKNNCEVICVSINSIQSNYSWWNAANIKFGLDRSVNFPLISDFNKEISKKYKTLFSDNSDTCRATIILDQYNMVRYLSYNDASVVRYGSDLLKIIKLIKLYRYEKSNHDSCPIKWGVNEDYINTESVDNSNCYNNNYGCSGC